MAVVVIVLCLTIGLLGWAVCAAGGDADDWLDDNEAWERRRGQAVRCEDEDPSRN